jgi:hypothetical protein
VIAVRSEADLGISRAELATLQCEQFAHDQRNHWDIACLSRADRLKHYGLHFAKYVGRLARGPRERISLERTVIDTALINLSAANVLHQRLDQAERLDQGMGSELDPLGTLADAAGRFADACEKIDHLEDFFPIARSANEDVLRWVLAVSIAFKIDLLGAIRSRRVELADRQFFIVD